MPVEQIAGQYQASPQTFSDGSTIAIQVDAQGRLIVVASSGGGYTSPVTLTRTADTNAYLAGDDIGAATGSTAALTFANIGPSGGGEVFITTVKLVVNISAIPSGMTSFVLYLYSATPPSALGDNAPFNLPSGDRATYLQPVNLGSPVDLGDTLAVVTSQVNQQITIPSGGSLYGYLVTTGAFTPASATVFTITLKSVSI
jgi:hypothetical protein